MKRIIPIKDNVEKEYVYGYLVLDDNVKLEDIQNEISNIKSENDFYVNEIMEKVCKKYKVQYFSRTTESLSI